LWKNSLCFVFGTNVALSPHMAPQHAKCCQETNRIHSGLILELEKLLGRRIEVVTDDGLNPLLREHVYKQAVLL
jgi:hypothetical protein